MPEAPTPTNPIGPDTVVNIIKGIKEVFGGKRISITSDRVSTDVHRCRDYKCPWKEKRESWRMFSTYNWPFKRWSAAEIHVLIIFEYNGCDLNNARLMVSGKSFNRWYNDNATFAVTAKGSPSKVYGGTGCNACCKASSCVVFDVQLEVSQDFIRTDVVSWEVKICGDGTVTVSMV